MRLSRIFWAIVVLAPALGISGCTAKAEPEVATAGGAPTATQTEATDDLTAYVEGVRAYVDCLRGEGIKVSDPDNKGKFTIEGDLKVLKSDPKFEAAQQRCGRLLPPVPAGLNDKPARTAEEIETARAYAKCMREHGAPDFPDPGPDGYFPDRTDGRPSWDQTSDGARRATRECAPIIGDPTDPGPGQG